ncbi:hypothetical protein [Salibacterium salarium]|uniref:hypothetical protein n=1 Tax=Salibacterium salarium TaxID=284579 RepID=UPI00163B42C0|nr:hypothetical protein [Salibacterium salarium]
MNINLLVWVIIGGVVGFISFGPPGMLIGIIAGVLIRITDQLSFIIDEMKKDG